MMLIALDCMVLSILTLGDHYRGATISALLWQLETEGKWRGRIFRPVVDWFFSWAETDHCQVSWSSEHYLRTKDRA